MSNRQCKSPKHSGSLVPVSKSKSSSKVVPSTRGRRNQQQLNDNPKWKRKRILSIQKRAIQDTAHHSIDDSDDSDDEDDVNESYVPPVIFHHTLSSTNTTNKRSPMMQQQQQQHCYYYGEIQLRLSLHDYDTEWITTHHDHPPFKQHQHHHHHDNSSVLSKKTWTVTVGDVVVVGTKDGVYPTRRKYFMDSAKKKPWYPFSSKWAVCQVLAIYSTNVADGDGGSSKEDGSDDSDCNTQNSDSETKFRAPKLKLKVRWFYRTSEFDLKKLESIPTDDNDDDDDDDDDAVKDQIDEIYESDQVDMDLHPDSILGRARIVLSDTPRIGDDVDDDPNNHHQHSYITKEGVVVPQVSFRCQTFISPGKFKKQCTISKRTGACALDPKETETPTSTNGSSVLLKHIARGENEAKLFSYKRLWRGLSLLSDLSLASRSLEFIYDRENFEFIADSSFGVGVQSTEKNRHTNTIQNKKRHLEKKKTLSLKRAKANCDVFDGSKTKKRKSTPKKLRNSSFNNTESSKLSLSHKKNDKEMLSDDQNTTVSHGKISSVPNKILLDDCSNGSSNDENSTSSAILPTATIFRDAKSGRLFFDGLEMDIPYTSYNLHYRNKFKKYEITPRWTVHVGDMVAVHVNSARPPRIKFQKHKEKWFPFDRTKWGVAQILSIFQDPVQSKQRKRASVTIKGGEIKINMRWFYRKTELIDMPITDYNDLDKFEGDNKIMYRDTLFDNFEEVYESDEFVIENPESILGRVQVFTKESHLQCAEAKVCEELVPKVTYCQRYVFSRESGTFCEISNRTGKCKYDEDELPYIVGELSKLDNSEDDGTQIMIRRIARGLRLLNQAYAYQIFKIICDKLKPKAMHIDEMEDDLDCKLKTQLDGMIDMKSAEEVIANVENDIEEVSGTNSEKEGARSNIEKPFFCWKKSRFEYREFYESISLDRMKEFLSISALRKLGKGKQWKVSVGDAICVSYRSSNMREQDFINRRNYKNEWYPFTIPWRPCQVLSIYKDKSVSKDSETKTSEIKIEVRWFFRKSDLSRNSGLEQYNATSKNLIEEVFETDSLAEIEANTVLGVAELLGYNEIKQVSLIDKIPVPVVEHTCNRFYARRDNFMVPIQTPVKNVLERALHFSKNLKAHKEKEEIRNIYSVAQTQDKAEYEENALVTEPYRVTSFTLDLVDVQRTYFSSVSLPLPWTCYEYSFEICHPHSRDPSWFWLLSVGDIVALHCNDSKLDAKGKRKKWFPYNVPWSPCQVLSIHKDTSSNSGASSNCLRLEVRWMYRAEDFDEDSRPSDSVGIFETDCVDEVDIESALGPIYLDEENELPTLQKEEKNSSRQIPIVRLVHNSSFYSTKRNHFLKRKFATKDIVSRGILHCGHQNKVQKAKYISWLNRELKQTQNAPLNIIANNVDHNESATDSQKGDALKGECKEDANKTEEGNTTNEQRVLIPNLPYHVDVSSLKAFFTEISILPPCENYDSDFDNNLKNNEQVAGLQSDNEHHHWNVRMGDAVAIHIAESKALRQAKKNQRKNKHYPFDVPWSTAEVISIYKILSTAKEAQALSDAIDDGNVECPPSSRIPQHCNIIDDFYVEVRWLYKTKDIPGMNNKSSDTSRSHGDDFVLDEVFETDEVKDISANALLSPVCLHSDPSHSQPPISTTNFGMPILHYHCHRIWSIYRKSLIPTGAVENRVDRGMLHSKYLGKDKVARAALDKGNKSSTKDFSISSTSQKSDWRKQFHDAIEKLTLTDASADVQMHGTVLTGREAEQNQIQTFLQSAICGANAKTSIENNAKYSLFVAGPPGTGKTASVRSVISRLRQQQCEGKVPSFDFVGLNGMEMRHPFDAYVRLWESVSPDKEKRSPGEAAARLESYFGGSAGRQNDGLNDRRRRSITVCLLDEIDYLLTRKQTVLYNLFDWPMRGSNVNNNNAQLIIIGISNTLNLPERLHPKVQSRLGRERCVFSAYNVQDTENILKSRLGLKKETSLSIFSADAINFASRKTAAGSGDIRKAFHLCKAAAEAVYADFDTGKRVPSSYVMPQICIDDIQRASRAMFRTMISKAVSFSTSFEALLLVSLASLKRQSGREQGGFDLNELWTKMEGIATAFGDEQYLPAPTFSELLGILSRLGEARIISLQTPNGRHYQHGISGAVNTIVSLQLDDYEVLNALKDTSHSVLAEKHLSRTLFF